MNRRRLALAVLGVLVLAAVVLIISFQRRGQPETWTVRRGDIEGTIEVSGRVAPANPVAARSAVESRVQTVAVAVGDHVQAGPRQPTTRRSGHSRTYSSWRRSTAWSWKSR
jgi:multidrug efflux pump subunit AcrA (membrane-fusion protein)